MGSFSHEHGGAEGKELKLIKQTSNDLSRRKSLIDPLPIY